jgi:hypothetical protein
MNIQVKENVNNRINSLEKIIDSRIVDISSATYDSIVWSFIVVNSPTGSTVYHSKDCEEGVYLNYNNPESPEISFLVDIEGTYSIKLTCRLTTYTEGTTDIRTLDNDGNLIESSEVVTLSNHEFLESNSIELVYKTSVDDGWI